MEGKRKDLGLLNVERGDSRGDNVVFEEAVMLTPLRGRWAGVGGGFCRAQNLAAKLWALNGGFRFTCVELEGDKQEGATAG